MARNRPRNQRKKQSKFVENSSDKGYVLCPVERRVELLLETVSRFYDLRQQCWTKKIAIIFCHSNCVKYFCDIFNWYKRCPVLRLLKRDVHAAAGQERLAHFTAGSTGCVAALPNSVSDWAALGLDAVIQYDPPASLEQVSRLSAACHWYTLFLRPQETSFAQACLDLKERRVPWKQTTPLDATMLRKRYSTDHFANITSKGAYKAYLDCLEQHPLQEHFSLKEIVYREVADAFCLEVTPRFVPKPPPTAPAPPRPVPSVVMKLVRKVREHDKDVAGEKLRQRKLQKLMKRGLLAPDMKIKNLSKNLKRADAVYSAKGDTMLRDTLNLPRSVDTITLKSSLDANPNFVPRARR